MNTKESEGALSNTLVHAAWLSVLLGLGVELVLLVVATCFKNSTGAQVIIADLVQKISWSTLVCVGVAVGTAAGKMRPQAMGLAGLISAPIAFYVAKVLHKSASDALSISAQAVSGGPSPFLLAFIRGLEYAVLGYFIGRMGKKAKASIREHALAGFVIGLIFGGTIVYLMVTMASKPLPLPGIVSRSLNEILFPVGCSLVLYTTQRLVVKKLSDENREAFI